MWQLRKNTASNIEQIVEEIKQQLYGHLPPITKTIQIRRTRHTGHCWRSKVELISDILLLTTSHGQAKPGRPARTFINSSVPIQDIALKTQRDRWMIETSGKRRSERSLLAVQHDDDDKEIYIFFFYKFKSMEACMWPQVLWRLLNDNHQEDVMKPVVTTLA